MEWILLQLHISGPLKWKEELDLGPWVETQTLKAPAVCPVKIIMELMKKVCNQQESWTVLQMILSWWIILRKRREWRHARKVNYTCWILINWVLLNTVALHILHLLIKIITKVISQIRTLKSFFMKIKNHIRSLRQQIVLAQEHFIKNKEISLKSLIQKKTHLKLDFHWKNSLSNILKISPKNPNYFLKRKTNLKYSKTRIKLLS